MIVFSYFLLLLITAQLQVIICRQAPGDEDDICITYPSDPFINQVVLMSSLNYMNLLETNGGPWSAVSMADASDMVSAR